MRRRLRALSACGAAAVLVGTAGAVTPAQADPAWQISYIHPEVAGKNTGFERIAVVNGRDAWAAGAVSSAGDGVPMIRRWDGTSWRDVPIPAELNWSGPVDASSPRNVWVFGPARYPATGGRALRWNGSSWKTTTLGRLRPTDAEVIARNDAWVVGNAGDDGARTRHWNGRRWRAVPTPDRPVAVSAVSRRDVWAVGDGEETRVSVMRWRGSKWKRVKIPNVDVPPGEEGVVELRDVAALSADNVWAVGKIVWNPPDGDGPLRTLLMHWNGEKWRVEIGDSTEDEFYMHVAPDGAGGVWMTTSGGAYVHHARDGEVTRVEAPIPDGRRWAPSLRELANVPGTTEMMAVGQYQPAGDGDETWDGVIQRYGGQGG